MSSLPEISRATTRRGRATVPLLVLVLCHAGCAVRPDVIKSLSTTEEEHVARVASVSASYQQLNPALKNAMDLCPRGRHTEASLAEASASHGRAAATCAGLHKGLESVRALIPLSDEKFSFSAFEKRRAHLETTRNELLGQSDQCGRVLTEVQAAIQVVQLATQLAKSEAAPPSFFHDESGNTDPETNGSLGPREVQQ